MNQSGAYSLFLPKTNEKDACFRVPRAILFLSHAQKTRALGSRLMASLVLTLVFAHARFLNAWSEFQRACCPTAQPGTSVNVYLTFSPI